MEKGVFTNTYVTVPGGIGSGDAGAIDAAKAAGLPTVDLRVHLDFWWSYPDRWPRLTTRWVWFVPLRGEGGLGEHCPRIADLKYMEKGVVTNTYVTVPGGKISILPDGCGSSHSAEKEGLENIVHELPTSSIWRRASSPIPTSPSQVARSAYYHCQSCGPSYCWNCMNLVKIK